MQTVYYLRSSVLGEVVAEATPAGARRVGFVHAGGELLATQSEGVVFYQHEDTSGVSKRTTDAGGALHGRDETDPRGVSVERPNNPTPQFRSGGGGGGLSPGGDERPFNPASLMDTSTCNFGGLLVPCALKGSFAQHISSLDAGGVDQWNGITTWGSVQQALHPALSEEVLALFVNGLGGRFLSSLRSHSRLTLYITEVGDA